MNIPTNNIEYYKKFKVQRVKDIKLYITYINVDNEIEIISRKKLYIENKDNTITRTQLVDVIKNSQRRNNTDYKLISVMVYNIHVTPETLSDYIEKPENFVSLFTLSRIDSFELQSTISMLKEFNAMYFFFFEVPQQPNPSLTISYPSPSPSPSSALPESREKGEKGEKEIQKSTTNTKMNPSSSKPHNTTKRIYIQNNNNKRNNNSNKKTKRYDKYVNLL